MIIRLRRIMAELEQEMAPSVPVELLDEFYNIGQAKMQEYLRDVEMDSLGLELLWDRVVDFYSQGYGMDDSAAFAAEQFAHENAHYNDLLDTPWFKQVTNKIKLAVGYVDPSGSGRKVYMPAGLPPMQRKQIENNAAALTDQLVAGLEDTEINFVEEALRAHFKDFPAVPEKETPAVEEPKKPQQVRKPKVEEVPEVEMDDDADLAVLLEEPADYSGRYAHAHG